MPCTAPPPVSQRAGSRRPAARRTGPRPRSARRRLPARRLTGGGAVHGMMQDVPLTLPHLFERGERLFADKEVVTVTAAGRDRLTYGDWAGRARRLGGCA